MGQRTWIKCDHKMDSCDLAFTVSGLAETISETIPEKRGGDA